MNWMHSCKRVAELLSQQLDEPLGLIDGLKLRLHLPLCGNCSNVAGQLGAVHAASAELFTTGLDLNDETATTDPPTRGTPARDGPR